ncbi:hypothetical protein [Agrobacterium tumefaciens]|uniref:hypothetical protein n=1 Tax=Agrobacterium tumefaciens TaxID=358 RepID=UPI0004720F63
MIKANELLIAWNDAEHSPQGKARAGSIAVGPLLRRDEPDWTKGYFYTGGAADTARRKLKGVAQHFHIMRDWYELVYGYDLHPFVVHTAFLHIDEYQEIIKDMGMGPDKGEFGHDPNFGYGRTVQSPVPAVEVKRIGLSVHVWPVESKGV